MECLWCGEEIIMEIRWQNVFWPEKPSRLCTVCKQNLNFIAGNRCAKCSRSTEEKICADCRRWEKQLGVDVLEWNYSLFSYNAFMKEYMAKWKYRGDYHLGFAFQDAIRQLYKEQFSFLKKDAVVVPIPLSKERLHERKFNQAKMLAEFFPLPVKEILGRKHGEKQAKKSRKERIFSQNPFFITETLNKPVILVDDIYTTGTTLRHAAFLLKEHGCSRVFAFTLIRG
ncbi:ComF family protein [Compostibacillus humi]|uniref:ComF family protein n=1 Tax=Compostibacillus humi TaxID=1245525 RepID=UPI00166A8CFF|nr:ComF family protein [Compostibacillus humi]